jgi:GNAT superfamily N-acetyltransferase
VSIEIHALAPERRADYLDFFDRRAFSDNPKWASCYCHYPHADHRMVAWPQRSGAENRAAVGARIDAGRMSGWLAYADGQVIGWCNAGPRSAAIGLVDTPDPPADRVATIACFVIAPPWRGRGVARALLAAACHGLAARGFEWVEAYPLRDERASAAAQHLGPLALYRAAGFDPIGTGGERATTMRKRLRASAAGAAADGDEQG